jgi:hypothetical protein
MFSATHTAFEVHIFFEHRLGAHQTTKESRVSYNQGDAFVVFVIF